jgi:hypothetical protein
MSKFGKLQNRRFASDLRGIFGVSLCLEEVLHEKCYDDIRRIIRACRLAIHPA